MASRRDFKTAVFFIAWVKRHPRSNTYARLRAQIIIILMQCLTTRLGRLEIEHCLYGKGFTPRQRGQALVYPLIEHPAQAHVIPTVHVDHSWIALQGIR